MTSNHPKPPTPTEVVRAIAIRGIAYRNSKGFVACTWESFPARLGHVHTEIGELAEAIDHWQRVFEPSHKPVSVGELVKALRFESADCVMLTSTMLEDLWPGEWTIRHHYHGGKPVHAPGHVVVSPMRKHADQAMRAWKYGKQGDAKISLELLIAAVMELRTRLVITTLAEDVNEKLIELKGRAALHGGQDPRC